MPKENPEFGSVLDGLDDPSPPQRKASAKKAAPQKQRRAGRAKSAAQDAQGKSREGTTLIGGHFPPEVAQQLAMIAAEERTTKQALLAEALNALFVKKGKKRFV